MASSQPSESRQSDDIYSDNSCGQSPPNQTTTPPSDGCSTVHTDDEQEPSREVNLQTPCYLENMWDIYFDDGSNKALSYESYQHSLVTIGNFSTVQGFWRYWGGISLESLPKYCNFRFFKHGVEPSWEDPANADGGKWSFSHSPQDRVMIWREIVFALIGEQFIRSEDMCGIVLSVRSRGDSVHLWNGCPLSSDEIAAISKQLRTILSLSESVPIEYQRHCDAISQSDEFNKRKKMTAHSPKSRKVPHSPHSLSPSTSPGNGRRNGKSNRPPRKPNSRQASLDADNNFDGMSNDMPIVTPELQSTNSAPDVADVIIMDIPTHTNRPPLQEPVSSRQQRNHSKQPPSLSQTEVRQPLQLQKPTSPELEQFDGSHSNESEFPSILPDGLLALATPLSDSIFVERKIHEAAPDILVGELAAPPATIALTTTPPILAPPSSPPLEQEQQAQQDPPVSEQLKANTEAAQHRAKRKKHKAAPSTNKDTSFPRSVATAPRLKSTRCLTNKSGPTLQLFYFAIAAIFALVLYITHRSGVLNL